MATTLPVTDKGDSLTDITKNMTKYIRHLEANVQSIKKIPTPEDILNEVKNNVWYRMCKPCQSKVFDISSKDLYSRNNYPSKRLCKEAKVTDIGNSKTRHKSKKSDLDESFDAPIEIEQMLAKRESMPHPLQLQDQEKKEDLQTKISILKNSIEEKNEKIRSLENQLKMHLKSHTENTEEKQGDFDTVQKEKEEYVEQLSQLQTERQALEDQTNSLTSTNEECSPTVEGLQRNIDRLTVELEKKQGDFDKSQQENEEYMREVAQLQTDRQTLQDQTSSINKTNEELLSSLKIKQQNTEKMTGELEEKQTELDKVQRENEMFVINISQLQTDIQKFKDQASFLSRTNEEMTPAMEGLQRNIDRLAGQLEEKQGDFDKVQNEKAEYLKEQSQLQRDIQTLQDETGSLNKTIKELSSTVESLQPDIDRMTGELVKKDEEINNLKTVLEESRRLKKKVVVMRLLRTSRSGLGKTMVDMVTKELTRQLGERLDSKSFDFSIVLSETPTDVSNGPLFVLCLNMSRVGTNIQDALEGTEGGRDVYVLVLHHTNKDNLSTLTPTSLRVTGSEIRQLGGIIDLAFSSNSGLYECDLNITAIGKIATVLKKF
ncbi:Laminin subunit alpha-2 [Mizuhopecten yessoensis]|uniref:Laminin subunit alpha-2 n=1 Tax=Mizuhopecten yessoensis TaxID=6573 RepID=A0A210PP25_MIZYE|nr:Laminin subunit alpha-2 [Mizuhopecten yessoensis]